MSDKHKHMEFIQSVINRMAHNSFLIKGWSIVLVSALFALSANNTNEKYIFLAYFPVIIFWGLDAYFLSQERKFRALYDVVRQKKENEIDFSMNTSEVKKEGLNWVDSFLSRTIWPFYGVLGVSILCVIFL